MLTYPFNFPTATWATLPPAAQASGLVYRVTDIGISGVGVVVVSDGSRWIPVGQQMLGRNAVAASVTGTTAETVLATVTIPAGAMGLNGGLLIYSTWEGTSSANNKTLRIRLGGAAGTMYYNDPRTTNSTIGAIHKIRNRNSASSQVGLNASNVSGGAGASAAAVVTSAVDTATSQDLVFSGQLALGTESIVLQTYEVWLLP